MPEHIPGLTSSSVVGHGVNALYLIGDRIEIDHVLEDVGPSEIMPVLDLMESKLPVCLRLLCADGIRFPVLVHKLGYLV